MLIGYARVSTGKQNPDSQRDALEAEGCERVYRMRLLLEVQAGRVSFAAEADAEEAKDAGANAGQGAEADAASAKPNWLEQAFGSAPLHAGAVLEHGNA